MYRLSHRIAAARTSVTALRHGLDVQADRPLAGLSRGEHRSVLPPRLKQFATSVTVRSEDSAARDSQSRSEGGQ